MSLLIMDPIEWEGGIQLLETIAMTYNSIFIMKMI